LRCSSQAQERPSSFFSSFFLSPFPIHFCGWSSDARAKLSFVVHAQSETTQPHASSCRLPSMNRWNLSSCCPQFLFFLLRLSPKQGDDGARGGLSSGDGGARLGLGRRAGEVAAGVRMALWAGKRRAGLARRRHGSGLRDELQRWQHDLPSNARSNKQWSRGRYSETPPMKMRCSICKVEFHVEMTVAGNSTPNVTYIYEDRGLRCGQPYNLYKPIMFV
jgi:hypothetical protein